MYYLSTRNTNLNLKSTEAIKNGLSEEGGLYVPNEIPKLSMATLKKLSNASYIERAEYVLGKFLNGFTKAEISNCCKAAYGDGKFSDEKVAPLVKLNDDAYILELWHGPTCAFKDMALQILPHFLTTAIKKTGEKKNVVILVATSGDTGKAALEGFKNVEGTDIAVFYPSDGVSDIQKLQMITQDGENVFVSAIDGNFDDAQTGVKAIFTDDKAKELLADKDFILSSANSINWGRLVPQIVYYVSAYIDLVKDGDIKMGDEINVCVPTGNFGNILAAYYAKKMGLPIKKFICASNSNNVLTEFIQTGVYDKNREFFTTISPSMDILISSNLERLLFDLCGNNGKKVSKLMNDLSKKGKYAVDASIKKNISELFWAGCCDDYYTKVTIWKTNTNYGYTPDTHTAVAIDVYEQYKAETGDTTKTIIASTASPFKFNDSVLSALGENVDGKNDFELLDMLSAKTNMEIPESLKELNGKEQRFTGICEKDKMFDEIKKFLDVE